MVSGAGGLAAKLGRFEVLEPIGRGGMAEVYKARMPGALGVNRDVAIKRILPEAKNRPEMVALFVAEARLCARMTHPNLIQVLELGEVEEELFMVMELVEGCDLRKVINANRALGRPLPTDLIVPIQLGLLRGLDAAHRLTDERGKLLQVIHRDLSPANVLLSYEGAVKVADFGVARVGAEAESTTVTGKLQYMAPEQVLGTDFDVRVDVFAAGCVFYEMLTGTPVFPWGDTADLVKRVARGQYVPIEQKLPGIDPDLAAVVRKALAAQRADRYVTCSSFADDLKRLVQAGKVPGASEADLGLYVQVLVPKETYRVGLARTPSPEDEAKPVARPVVTRGETSGPVVATPPSRPPQRDSGGGAAPTPPPPPSATASSSPRPPTQQAPTSRPPTEVAPAARKPASVPPPPPAAALGGPTAPGTPWGGLASPSPRPATHAAPSTPRPATLAATSSARISTPGVRPPPPPGSTLASIDARPTTVPAPTAAPRPSGSGAPPPQPPAQPQPSLIRPASAQLASTGGKVRAPTAATPVVGARAPTAATPIATARPSGAGVAPRAPTQAVPSASERPSGSGVAPSAAPTAPSPGGARPPSRPIGLARPPSTATPAAPLNELDRMLLAYLEGQGPASNEKKPTAPAPQQPGTRPETQTGLKGLFGKLRGK